MLTRIEVDGFKNLIGFSAEFGPFTCVAGPNAVGKSNLFDVIEFLSLLADHPFERAAGLVRATPGVARMRPVVSLRSIHLDEDTERETLGVRVQLRSSELVEILFELGSDPREDLEPQLDELEPYDQIRLRQVIINTHSSDLVRHIYERRPEDLLLATTVLTSGPEGTTARALRLNPIAGTWRCSGDVRGVVLPVVDYVGAAVRRVDAASAAEEG